MTSEKEGAAMQDAWRTYLELAMGLGETSRKRVRKVVKEAVGKGNATADQVRNMSSDLIAANAANREALSKLVKFEVDRALGRVGLATAEEVRELTTRVRDLERQLREARADGAGSAPTKTTASRTTAAKRTTKAAPARATATKTTATKATASKATASKATPTKATSRPSAAKKTATSTRATAKRTPAKAQS